MVREPVNELPFVVAVIVTGVTFETAVVDTEKVAKVEPAGTVTLEGVVALVLLVDKLTTKPLGPA